MPAQPPSEFRRELREQVLQSAFEQLEEVGWDHVRVGKIAEAVGVSRPTIYAEFGNKEGIGEALVLREVDDFIQGVLSRLERNKDDPEKAFRSSVQYTFMAAKKSPVLRVALSGEQGADSLLQLLTTRSQPVIYTATDRLVEWFVTTFPAVSPKQARPPIDAIVRLMVSFVMFPGTPQRDVPERLSKIAMTLLSAELTQIDPSFSLQDMAN